MQPGEAQKIGQLLTKWQLLLHKVGNHVCVHKSMLEFNLSQAGPFRITNVVEVGIAMDIIFRTKLATSLFHIQVELNETLKCPDPLG